MPRRMRRILPPAIAAICLLVPPAAAQQGNAPSARGADLAHRWCSGCHRIDTAGSGAMFATPPSLPDVGRRPGVTAESLRRWISESHTLMPRMRLSPRERDELASYILSFGARAPQMQ